MVTATVPRNPVVTTWYTENPGMCATGVVSCAPLVTVQVVPETFVTAIISEERAVFVSAT